MSDRKIQLTEGNLFFYEIYINILKLTQINKKKSNSKNNNERNSSKDLKLRESEKKVVSQEGVIFHLLR